ncbi:hypothetical protein J5N97_000593 [Dioscorea zingiberensis]|uniref:Uncharacterized protein n=1 Tax=Dioscorea zingiberensis TaxID=325984 RepID=A0A9D5H1F3_9LILI|nr:hypothetical protein J5N97_000593 [Dioscorea zingiberensis]
MVWVVAGTGGDGGHGSEWRFLPSAGVQFISSDPFCYLRYDLLLVSDLPSHSTTLFIARPHNIATSNGVDSGPGSAKSKEHTHVEIRSVLKNNQMVTVGNITISKVIILCMLKQHPCNGTFKHWKRAFSQIVSNPL